MEAQVQSLDLSLTILFSVYPTWLFSVSSTFKIIQVNHHLNILVQECTISCLISVARFPSSTEFPAYTHMSLQPIFRTMAKGILLTCKPNHAIRPIASQSSNSFTGRKVVFTTILMLLLLPFHLLSLFQLNFLLILKYVKCSLNSGPLNLLWEPSTAVKNLLWGNCGIAHSLHFSIIFV